MAGGTTNVTDSPVLCEVFPTCRTSLSVPNAGVALVADEGAQLLTLCRFMVFILWFSSYLTDRTHYVSLSNHCSDFAPVHSGVPQGSDLGPMLFTMYIMPLSAIIDSHSIIHHSFADDLQLQMSAPPDRISELLHSMQSCISDVKAWATANMLKLNDSKT